MTNRIYNNICCSRRLPAEWEHYDAVLMAWPHQDTDWRYMLDDVQSTFIEIVKTIVDDGLIAVIVSPDDEEPRGKISFSTDDKVIYVTVDTNDTWTRDFGVITCVSDTHEPLRLDFKFNGWGLKFAANRDNLITSFLYNAGLLQGQYENRLGFVLEGGAIESDGKGTVLTTSKCLLSPNRNGDMSRTEIENYLKNALGADRILWLDYGYLAGDDTDSHVDTLARLVSDDTIVYVKCDDPYDEHYEQLCMMESQLMGFRTCDGRPYHLVGLPMPHPIYDYDGLRLPATYANFLITPTSVLLPVYGQEQKDMLAENILKNVFPDRKIHTINCTTLIQQHGSLHCMTMQLPFFEH